MRPFSLLVKPASALCNLDCKYCFYKRVLQIYPEDEHTRKMDLYTAENMIEKFLSLRFPAVSICFQGGEPLLMGLDFYQGIIELEKKHGFPGQIVGNSFQTNGILINEEWADFFKEYNMLLGVSLDGEKEVHDYYRINYNGEGSFDKVMSAISILEDKGVDFNILAMITPISSEHVENIYNFFRKNNFNYLQFIPCLGVNHSSDNRDDFLITSDDYGNFYKKLFDLWFEDGYPEVSIRLFDDILLWLVEGRKELCCHQDACNSYLLIEHNGDVYPCDFFVYKEWKLGNINENDYTELTNSKKRLEFSALKTEFNGECKECRFFSYCLGDCTIFRTFPDKPLPGRSYLCPGFRDFLEYTEKRFLELRDDVLRKRRKHIPRPEI